MPNKHLIDNDLYDGHTASSIRLLSETMHLLLQRLCLTFRMEFLSPILLHKHCDHFVSDQLYIKMLKSPRVHHFSNTASLILLHTPKPTYSPKLKPWIPLPRSVCMLGKISLVGSALSWPFYPLLYLPFLGIHAHIPETL